MPPPDKRNYPPRYLAQSKGNPFLERELIGLQTTFGKRALEIRFGGREPTWYDHMNLALVGRELLETAFLFWGDDNHPERLRWADQVQAELSFVEQRIRENEVLREAAVRRAQAEVQASDNLQPAARPRRPADRPKRNSKGRRGRKEIDDSAELAKARNLVLGGKTEWAAAQSVATDRYPKEKDANLREKLGRRVWEKLRKGALR